MPVGLPELEEPAAVAIPRRPAASSSSTLSTSPTNLRGAPFVVAIVVSGKGPVSFDAGRAAQNMLLAAWNEGVGGSPNGIADEPSGAGRHSSSRTRSRIAIVLSFGYPAKPRDPKARSVDEWSARANRRPLQESVRRR